MIFPSVTFSLPWIRGSKERSSPKSRLQDERAKRRKEGREGTSRPLLPFSLAHGPAAEFFYRGSDPGYFQFSVTGIHEHSLNFDLRDHHFILYSLLC